MSVKPVRFFIGMVSSSRETETFRQGCVDWLAVGWLAAIGENRVGEGVNRRGIEPQNSTLRNFWVAAENTRRRELNVPLRLSLNSGAGD